MAKPAKRPATYDDLLKVPEHLVAEIIDGELYTSPRPAPPHALASSILGGRLVTTFGGGGDGPGGWWILDEPEIHLGAEILVPDIAGWRRERMPVLPDGAAFDLVPDWICEVVSPSTGRMDRVRKLPAYARFGVAYAWLVDPAVQTIEAYRGENGRWTILATHGGDEVVHLEPFEAIEIRLATLWLP